MLKFTVFALICGAARGFHGQDPGLCNAERYTLYESRAACVKSCAQPCVGSLIECAVYDPSFAAVIQTAAESVNGSTPTIMGRCLHDESVFQVMPGVQTNADEHYGFSPVNMSAASAAEPCQSFHLEPEISDIKLQLALKGELCGVSSSSWNASVNVKGEIFGVKTFDNSFELNNEKVEFNQSPNLGIVKADYSVGGYKVGNEMHLKFFGNGCYWSSFVWHCKFFDWVLVKWSL